MKDSVTRSPAGDTVGDTVMISPSLVLPLVSFVLPLASSAAGVAGNQAGGEPPRDVDAGVRVGHQEVLSPRADADALGLQVPGGAVQVGDLERERVIGVVGRGR